jgi:hypothetical protein
MYTLPNKYNNREKQQDPQPPTHPPKQNDQKKKKETATTTTMLAPNTMADHRKSTFTNLSLHFPFRVS